MAAISSYYAFDIPKILLDSLEPFKYQDNVGDDSDSDSNTDESDDDEDDLPESRDLTPIPESDDNSVASKATDIAPSASHLTQYNDDFEDMDQWKLANFAHISGYPYAYFSSPKLPESNVLAIYKVLFDKDLLRTEPLKALKLVQPEGKSAVFMIGGGHFSGAIISHKSGHHKLNRTNPFANIQVLESKSFHRYTTRKKQGGSQSASDNAHGKANSAGSNIRRQMEQQLRQEIQALMVSWASQLKDCQGIYYRASGRTNKGILFGFQGGPLERDDPRLRSLPFTTKRATADEVKRAWLRLTKAPVVDAPTVEPAKPVLSKPVHQSPSRDETPEAQQLAPEHEASDNLLRAIRKSDLPRLRSIFTSLGDEWDFRLQPSEKYKANPTALLFAARNDKHNVVTALLDWGANPTLKGSGQAIGEMPKHDKTLEAMQIARRNLGEDKWNWNSAKIGPPMTPEEILVKKTEEKLKLKEEQDAMFAKQEAEQRAKQMEKLISKHGSGRQTGGNAQASAGLCDKDLAQVERERRARAAEARLARFK